MEPGGRGGREIVQLLRHPAHHLLRHDIPVLPQIIPHTRLHMSPFQGQKRDIPVNQFPTNHVAPEEARTARLVVRAQQQRPFKVFDGQTLPRFSRFPRLVCDLVDLISARVAEKDEDGLSLVDTVHLGAVVVEEGGQSVEDAGGDLVDLVEDEEISCALGQVAFDPLLEHHAIVLGLFGDGEVAGGDDEVDVLAGHALLEHGLGQDAGEVIFAHSRAAVEAEHEGLGRFALNVVADVLRDHLDGDVLSVDAILQGPGRRGGGIHG